MSVDHRLGRPVRAWQSGDCACLWITGLVGLRGTVWGRSCKSEGWEFEGDPASLWSGALVGLRSGPEDRRSHVLQSSGSAGLWGRAWHAAPAVF
jgi:hypothetical protein